ncbi:bacterioferritin-associated ferredoxin [Halopseudomonas litoralis]|uniref:Bacterioferritin-associated ferredoxin n=1 Tax=Halopseudomonas litoralis TaxID=797277 RepID=A0A1H1SSH9_9GAMM|nr:bacterioferritin-associated ferredoxin [Halopseudomonas litoralis]SDS50977.1 bacterioferritin-associated ferredoxin [Halopseudomonas litoralis]
MYVCLCKGITDTQIRDAVTDGACSMRDLRERLDVANQCGKCGRDCKSIISEYRVAASASFINAGQFAMA